MKEVALGLLSLYAVFDVVAIAAMLLILWGDLHDITRRNGLRLTRP